MYNPESSSDRKLLATVMLNMLADAKFKEEESHGERIFSFPVGDRSRIVVYTSIVGDSVRLVAKDAIRVCALYKSLSSEREVGLVKLSRVNRVGEIKDIVTRTLERMRETYRRIKSGEICYKCGAPMFVTKKGNLCCAERCFAK